MVYCHSIGRMADSAFDQQPRTCQTHPLFKLATSTHLQSNAGGSVPLLDVFKDRMQPSIEEHHDFARMLSHLGSAMYLNTPTSNHYG